MKNDSPLRVLICWGLVISAFVVGIFPAHAQDCPSFADEIATDRPDITNSSLVVPQGSVQAENGVDWTVRYGSNAMDATNTRVRLGVAHCSELLMDMLS